MKDTDFALKKEENDYILLEDFNKVLHLNYLGRTKEKETTDASGVTTDGRTVLIELKERNQTLLDDFTLSGTTSQGKPYTADTIYIETHKVGDMLLDYVCDGVIPLYINFLQDGVVVLYNLTTLSNRPKKVVKRIYSKLYQGFELAKRNELAIKDAWIYKRENETYKLIYKPCKTKESS